MPTSDVQRMRQDEWLGALRSGEFVQGRGGLTKDEKRCALEVGVDILGLGLRDYLGRFQDYFGVSGDLTTCLFARNDGWWSLNPTPGRSHSFDEIADWFKEQRDLWNGDLTEWEPA